MKYLLTALQILEESLSTGSSAWKRQHPVSLSCYEASTLTDPQVCLMENLDQVDPGMLERTYRQLARTRRSHVEKDFHAKSCPPTAADIAWKQPQEQQLDGPPAMLEALRRQLHAAVCATAAPVEAVTRTIIQSIEFLSGEEEDARELELFSGVGQPPQAEIASLARSLGSSSE